MVTVWRAVMFRTTLTLHSTGSPPLSKDFLGSQKGGEGFL